ncbi:DIS3-like exonuclease 1 [Eurytemora carolleeae]|uniref:DIS3-like exonuclease 1 n=1 Tax=Eurytemora carolleeae TaxID=1294199 RepID=UPI000C75C764|nr:DIS3-like exonuclease 1 [Eurytemora carolleeae]|eukprot:XP_023335126.1 DIS3-like exonuclease 1 [Eurytemora affinis]
MKEEISNLESVTKKIQIKTRRKIVGVVRESYLRNDISCSCELCFEGCSSINPGKVSLLPSDLEHYIIPGVDIVAKFMDILELQNFSGLIFPQTVVNIIQLRSLKHYRRVCNYIRDQIFPKMFRRVCNYIRDQLFPKMFRRVCNYIRDQIFPKMFRRVCNYIRDQ